MQKVYADKKLGIDPKAVFQKPAELNNDPIFADQNFSNLVKEGQGNDIESNGNGDAGDYETTAPNNIPVESEFNKATTKDNSPPSTEKKVIGPVNMADEFKKDSSKMHQKNADEKGIDYKPNKGEDKSKKPAAKPAKPSSDY